MARADRAALRRRYLSLGLGELTAGVVFAFLAVTVVGLRLDRAGGTAALWSALVPLLLILGQASAYWLLARRWVGKTAMPATLARVFRAARVLNVALLVLGLVGVIIWLPDRVGAALLVVGIWAFAVIEYINYFVVRLAYPLQRWSRMVTQWRTPQIVKDIESASI